MDPCQIAPLPDRGVLRVAGADARKFLQGLITNDIDRVRDGTAVFAGLLTPQGKILFEFFIAAAGDALLVECARSSAADLARRLGFYKLRAAVEIADVSGERSVFAAWNGALPSIADATVFADPRLPALGHRIIAKVDTGQGLATATEVDYHAHRIGHGAPEAVRDFALGALFPHEADYDQLQGVDFRKGCFVGQEVVSRMEHRGTARSRIVPVEAVGALPPLGTRVLAGDLPVGTLGSSAGPEGLALIRLDRAGGAIDKGTPLLADGVALTLRHPAWARFPMPVTAV